jgi:hypothetical protein
LEAVEERGREGGKRLTHEPKPTKPRARPADYWPDLLSLLHNFGALNLRGRAQGLVGFDLYLDRLPPSQLPFFLTLPFDPA